MLHRIVSFGYYSNIDKLFLIKDNCIHYTICSIKFLNALIGHFEHGKLLNFNSITSIGAFYIITSVSGKLIEVLKNVRSNGTMVLFSDIECSNKAFIGKPFRSVLERNVEESYNVPMFFKWVVKYLKVTATKQRDSNFKKDFASTKKKSKNVMSILPRKDEFNLLDLSR